MLKKGNAELILHGNLLQAVMMLTIPVVINSFLQTMYNLADTYWMGRLGTEQLAAINLVTPVQNIILNFGAGITVAGSVLISQLLGAKKEKEAGDMLNHIFVCAMMFSLVCAGLCFVGTPAIVGWLGAEGNILEYARVYLQIVVLDMPFLFIINIFTSLYQAHGDTVRPMLLNLVGISLNLILDPLFMINFGWGVAGAAIATVLAKCVPAAIALVGMHNLQLRAYLHLRHFKWNKSKLKDILVVGLPTAVGGSTLQVGFLLMSRNVFAYGSAAMAAYGIGNKVNSLISLPASGFGSAVSTMVGQNVGAGQLERADASYKLSRKIIVVFLLVGGLILSRPFISGAIVSIFSSDPEVIAMAADFLSIMAISSFTNGVHNTTIGLFQGSGHTEISMAVEVSRLWVFRFITLYIFESWLHMGVRSIWFSVAISNAIAAVLLYICYKLGLWKKKRIHVD